MPLWKPKETADAEETARMFRSTFEGVIPEQVLLLILVHICTIHSPLCLEVQDPSLFQLGVAEGRRRAGLDILRALKIPEKEIVEFTEGEMSL